MTVNSTEPIIKYPYTGPGNYSFPFVIFNALDIQIVYTDSEGLTTLLRLGFDYSVTFNSTVDGGTCHLTWEETAGYIDIRRVLPVIQETDWVNNDPFNAEILEDDLDKIIMILQQMEVITEAGASTTNWRGDWITDFSYVIKDLIAGPNLNLYTCVVNHLSGVFTDDLATGYWQLVVDVEAVEAARLDAEESAAEAAASAEEAAISETNAGLSESHSAQAEASSANSEINAANCSAEATDSAELAEYWAGLSSTANLAGIAPVVVTPQAPPNEDIKDISLADIDGRFIPNGGTDGQALTKIDSVDRNVQWTDVGGTVDPIFYDVKEYGATGDGVTNDTAAILSAIVAAQATEGGIIHFPPGHYAIANLVIPINTQDTPLDIRGSRSAKLIPHSSHITGTHLVTLDGTHSNRTYWISIRDLVLDGEHQRAHGLLVRPCNALYFRNLYINSFEGCGLETESVYDVYCTEIRCIGCGDNQYTSSFNAATAVVPTTNRITITAHSFLNGERVRYVEGTTKIGGVSDSTTYYLKVVDANTVELFRDRTLNLPVDITSIGAGTATLTTAEFAISHNIDGISNQAMNFITWTDCNIEGYRDGGLYLGGANHFKAKGGKIHGIYHGETYESTGPNVEIDGGGHNSFIGVLFTSCGNYHSAVWVRDNYWNQARPSIWSGYPKLTIDSCYFVLIDYNNAIRLELGRIESKVILSSNMFAATTDLANGYFISIGNTVRQPNLVMDNSNSFTSYEANRILLVSDWFDDGSDYTNSWLNALSSTSCINVRDFGAVGDAYTDDAGPIRAAAAAAWGKTLYFPDGRYKIDSNVDLGKVTVRTDPNTVFSGTGSLIHAQAFVMTSEATIHSGKIITDYFAQVQISGNPYFLRLYT